MEREKNKLVRIEAYGRVHITLLSMVAGSYRRNGGLGFAVSSPSLIVEACPAKHLDFCDKRLNPLSKKDFLLLRNLVRSLCEKENIDNGYLINISGDDFISHAGFGSGTALRLAIIDGIFLIEGINSDRKSIVLSSGRGGASGIGVNTYFDGGYVFDLGCSSRHGDFTSSEDSLPGFDLPLVIAQTPMPSWDIGLCMPKLPVPSTKQERMLFETCPLPLEDCAEAAFHSLFGVHASILTEDYSAFCVAINAIQRTSWKRAEWNLHGEILSQVKLKLMDCGADCVGLSSLGPGLFFMSKDVDKTVEMFRFSYGNLAKVIRVSARNSGRKITHV